LAARLFLLPAHLFLLLAHALLLQHLLLPHLLLLQHLRIAVRLLLEIEIVVVPSARIRERKKRNENSDEYRDTIFEGHRLKLPAGDDPILPQ
jgi:hypothetical protein